MSAGDVIKPLRIARVPIITLLRRIYLSVELCFSYYEDRSVKKRFFTRGHMRLLIFMLEKGDMIFIIFSYIFL